MFVNIAIQKLTLTRYLRVFTLTQIRIFIHIMWIRPFLNVYCSFLGHVSIKSVLATCYIFYQVTNLWICTLKKNILNIEYSRTNTYDDILFYCFIVSILFVYSAHLTVFYPDRWHFTETLKHVEDMMVVSLI